MPAITEPTPRDLRVSRYKTGTFDGYRLDVDDTDGPYALVGRKQDAELFAVAPQLLDAVNGLLGLVQLISHRDDVPADLPGAMQQNHRYVDALALVQRIEGGR